MTGYRVALMFASAGGIILLAGLLFAACEHISRVENAEGSEHPRQLPPSPAQGVADPATVLPHSRTGRTLRNSE